MLPDFIFYLDHSIVAVLILFVLIVIVEYVQAKTDVENPPSRKPWADYGAKFFLVLFALCFSFPPAINFIGGYLGWDLYRGIEGEYNQMLFLTNYVVPVFVFGYLIWRWWVNHRGDKDKV